MTVSGFIWFSGVSGGTVDAAGDDKSFEFSTRGLAARVSLLVSSASFVAPSFILSSILSDVEIELSGGTVDDAGDDKSAFSARGLAAGVLLLLSSASFFVPSFCILFSILSDAEMEFFADGRFCNISGFKSYKT